MTVLNAEGIESDAGGQTFPALPAERIELLQNCQEAIGYRFRNPVLLLSALTHASSSDSRICSNERLEFLGDSILGLVICEQLFRRFPNLLEGELTKIKSVVVSRRTCARVSRHLGLEKYLILGKGMTTQALVPMSVMADAFESLIAAVYLDRGLEAANHFVLDHLEKEIQNATQSHHGGNYKSILQQMAQKEFGTTPTYLVLEEQGPDHLKSFKVVAVIGKNTYPAAWGENKKDAEQRAALNALCEIKGLPIPTHSELVPNA